MSTTVTNVTLPDLGVVSVRYRDALIDAYSCAIYVLDNEDILTFREIVRDADYGRMTALARKYGARARPLAELARRFW